MDSGHLYQGGSTAILPETKCRSGRNKLYNSEQSQAMPDFTMTAAISIEDSIS